MSHMPSSPSSQSLASMKEFADKLSSIISPYKKRFEELLSERENGGEYGFVDELKKASVYALVSGGKRFRPAIVWMMAEALSKTDSRLCDNLALAVEYFHTASLIADDLPCMDNDDFRRGIPTTHKVFNEATALLASFSLIALGFESIAKAPLPHGATHELYQRAVIEASRTMGAMGLIGGQTIDLTPPNHEKETIEKIIDMKTVALFDLSFILGWLFGGGSVELIPHVNSLARDFGRAFQILDDLDDLEKDRAQGKLINYALRFGVQEAIKEIRRYVDRSIKTMKELGLYKEYFAHQEKGALIQAPLVELTQLLSIATHQF